MDDGSMHSFKKEHHITNVKELDDFLGSDRSINAITTPNYPFKEFKLPELIGYFSTIPTWNTDTKILVHQKNLRQAELNLLFKYYKVCTGNVNAGIGVLFGDSEKNWRQWNPAYSHWRQMQPWELREWFSIFYPGAVEEFITAPQHVTDEWLIIGNDDILYDTQRALETIIEHCGLTTHGDLKNFVKQWQRAQRYIVDEFDLLDQIVQCSIQKQPLKWNPLNIISESIIQQRLRTLGYEIRCDGLNTFSTDSKMLYNLLEQR